MNESCIRFTDEQYEQLRRNYRKWWNGELDRPIVPIITTGHESARKPSLNPTLQFPTAWDFSISPEQFVDAHDWNFSTMRWHGDGFPMFPTISKTSLWVCSTASFVLPFAFVVCMAKNYCTRLWALVRCSGSMFLCRYSYIFCPIRYFYHWLSAGEKPRPALPKDGLQSVLFGCSGFA